MASHHCRTYPQDPYCSCYNQAGEPQYHYKQFDTLGQTYNCCDQITVSLNQLDDILEEGDTTITENAKDFFKKYGIAAGTGGGLGTAALFGLGDLVFLFALLSAVTKSHAPTMP